MNWLATGQNVDFFGSREAQLLVHHGYKFLNDEAWNLIAKRQNKRCRAFLSIGTLVWSLKSAEVTVAKAPKSVLWAADSISFFFFQ